ncbi:MAG: hypothetical protein AAGJ97_02760 [Planctomycetota bacterium]
MARRRQADPDFGSDSFLDIVANIVGILIILIVIVGLRVGQVAVESPPDEQIEAPIVTAEDGPDVAPVALMPLPPPARPPRELVSIAPDLEPEVRVVVRPLKPVITPQADPRLVDELARLEREVAATGSAAADLEQAVASAEADAARQAEIAAALREDLRRAASTLAAGDRELRTGIAAAAGLREDLLDALRRKSAAGEPAVEQIRHDLSPAARRVRGPELHFLVAGGSVAEVPLEALVSELRPTVSRQVNFIVRSGRGTGEVGPIGGFRLRYLVRTGTGDVLDSLRSSSAPGAIRVEVAGYKIVPDASLRGETVAEATDADSAFRRALDLATPGTAITFWVYPDGFDAFAALQSFAHRAGFTVAGRPLPEGVPITGSPNGSRSLGR